MKHLVAGICAGASSRRMLRVLTVTGVWFATTVVLDRLVFEVDELTYFGIAGSGVSFLGAAWWKVAEFWRSR